MNSPFPASASAPGDGTITVKRLPNGHSHLECITYQYPLKLISPPKNHQQDKSVLVFLLSYGGGLVGGDTVSLNIDVQRDARLSIVTQGHTKIFKSAAPDIVTRQTLNVTIQDGAALCLLPDPVQPFAESVYEQTQIFKLRGPGASLFLLDWVTQGRSARGEDWDLIRWVGRNEVWWSSAAATKGSGSGGGGGRLLVRDAVKLDGMASLSAAAKDLRATMYGLGIFGTLILRGPLAKSLGEFFVAEFAALPRIGARDWRTEEAKLPSEGEVARDPHVVWREERLEMERREKVLWSAAGVRGCVVVKFGAATVEAGRLWIGAMLANEGTVEEQFGDQALMCVR
ncbi:urease accessory protein UreD [Diaporthe helianthi]|uniref:Urease accessory protein UreD n=1 Tax=Diaporthe helianthi TaxID=158607 RepID=A0A2P5IAE4_DIAHE|nr:urease accessory protein UreD [Diaporthe helianthi]